MEHIVVNDGAAFNELAHEGELSARMFLSLKRAKPYDWKYYRIRKYQSHEARKRNVLGNWLLEIPYSKRLMKQLI